jgi:predicted nucleotidyltransferase
MNLNSAAVRKVLPLLALRPGEGFTLTDICRFTGLDTKSVTRVLEQFRADGFLLDNAFGPRTYSANPEYSMYPEIKSIAFRLLDLPASIREAGGQVYFMAAFGSLLRPTYRRDSDIDVLVVTSTPAAAKIGIAQVSARLGKRVSVQVYGPDQFSVALSQSDPFVREVLERPHAILAGSLEYFGANA